MTNRKKDDSSELRKQTHVPDALTANPVTEMPEIKNYYYQKLLKKLGAFVYKDAQDTNTITLGPQELENGSFYQGQ